MKTIVSIFLFSLLAFASADDAIKKIEKINSETAKVVAGYWEAMYRAEASKTRIKELSAEVEKAVAEGQKACAPKAFDATTGCVETKDAKGK